MTLVPDALRSIAGRYPDRAAVAVDQGSAMTFGEWERASNRLARGLVHLGLEPGDRVAILTSQQDAVLCFIAYFGTQKAGGVPAPINVRLSRTEITHILEIAVPRVLVVSADQLARASEAVVVLDPRPIVVSPTAHRRADSLDETTDRTWESLLAFDDDAIQVPIAETDLADILFTSGTTGLPKGVASTHENVLSIAVLPSEREDVLLHAAPLGTALGTYGAMLAGLRLALTNVCLPTFSTTRFASLVAERHPGWLMVVPAHVHLLREEGALHDVDTSSVTMVLCGTAPLPQETFTWLADQFTSALVMNAYSLTEAGDAACLMSHADAMRHPGSVGKPLTGGAIRAVDESGTVLSAHEVGELELRLRRGRRFYFGDPAATDRTWHDGWVRSGDLGYLDDDGFVYVVDRKKDMIIRGGFNVYSVEVENALQEHPAITEAAVVGVPHRILGQDVLAIVRIEPGSSISLPEVHDFLGDRLADYKHPRALLISEDPLPRTVAGKLDKETLRRVFAEHGPPAT